VSNITLAFTAARILCEFTAGVLVYRMWDLGVRPFRHTITALLVLMLGSMVIDLIAEFGEAGFSGDLKASTARIGKSRYAPISALTDHVAPFHGKWSVGTHASMSKTDLKKSGVGVRHSS
jgi:hypothetical protein